MPRYLFPVAIMSTTFLKAECSLPYISVMCCGEGSGGDGGKGRGEERRRGRQRDRRRGERGGKERETEFGGVEDEMEVTRKQI